MLATQLVVPVVLWGPNTPTHCVSSVFLSRDQRTLATGCYDGQICLWQMDPDTFQMTPRCLLRMLGDKNWFFSWELSWFAFSRSHCSSFMLVKSFNHPRQQFPGEFFGKRWNVYLGFDRRQVPWKREAHASPYQHSSLPHVQLRWYSSLLQRLLRWSYGHGSIQLGSSVLSFVEGQSRLDLVASCFATSKA